MSPKNKGKFGKGKPIEEPQDEFVSAAERVSHRLAPHAKKIFLCLGVILAGVGLWSGYRYYRDKKAQRATKEFAEAISTSRREIQPPPPAADQDAGAAPAPEPASELGDEQVKYASEEERNRAVLSALGDIERSARVAGQARLLEASTLFRLGELDQAIEAYQAYDGPDEMAWIAREGVAYALEARAAKEKDAAAREAGMRAALEQFRTVQPEAGKPGHDVTLWHEARLLAQLGERDKAIAVFQALRDLDPPSPLKSSAESRLAMLQAGKVAANAPAPAPADPKPATPVPVPAPAAPANP